MLEASLNHGTRVAIFGLENTEANKNHAHRLKGGSRKPVLVILHIVLLILFPTWGRLISVVPSPKRFNIGFL